MSQEKVLEKKTVAVGREKHALNTLYEIQETHKFWNNALFVACQKNRLSKDDFKYIFSQYFCYSRDFTRYLCALMANCESDFYRSLLSENLWEEGGGCEPEKRHTQLFRNFLFLLGIQNPDAIEFETYADTFARTYLQACSSPDPLYASAFLSLGTESIVARMYAVFVKALKKLGFSDTDLEFFHLHMACDDAHTETLEKLVLSYQHRPDWELVCKKAMVDALNLRCEFFEQIFESIFRSKMHSTCKGILEEKSLYTNGMVLISEALKGEPLYANVNLKQNIDFSIQRLFNSFEVLDPRTNKIQAGKNTEKHRHAHETYMYILEGRGYIEIDGAKIIFKSGDSLCVPRWSVHQTFNTSSNEILHVLAVTDFNLIKKFPGNTENSARQKQQKHR